MMVRLTPSECRRVARVLQSYLDGETAPDTSRMVADHLETCRRCGLEARTYLAIKAALTTTGAEEPLAADADAVHRLRRFADGLGTTDGTDA